MKENLKIIFKDMAIVKATAWMIWWLESGLIVAGAVIFIVLPGFYHASSSMYMFVCFVGMSVLIVLQFIAAIGIYRLSNSDNKWPLVLIVIGTVSNPGYFIPAFWTLTLNSMAKNRSNISYN